MVLKPRIPDAWPIASIRITPGTIGLPGKWPSYFSKAKGCEIWDLNNKKYYDFAGMGVTACVLGYADSFVNKKVKSTIDKASLTTLNSISRDINKITTT